MTQTTDDRPGSAPPAPDMEWVPGGRFAMGSEEHYPEEAPVIEVEAESFWIDRYQVTNDQFSDFVKATNYVTVAERPLDPAAYPGAPAENLVPGSMVFSKTRGQVDLSDYSNWWSWTPGARWTSPEGPGSDLEGRGEHPVVHVAHEDATAYATWAGKALPSEAEWERAARGGLDGCEFVWGDEKFPDASVLANWWQGEFPWLNSEDDGFEGTAPVGSFPANGFGLFDMAGNVWEWTDEWFVFDRVPAQGCCTPSSPRAGTRDESYNPHRPEFRIPRKVLKGGSFLCADNYCMRYRPAARQAQDVDTGMSHIGFRCVVRP